jgi:Cu2+-exporting ATPase
VPITLAILLAIATSIWETALSGEHAYFDAAIALTFFLLAGRYLDHRTRVLARSAAQELTALEVPRAMVLRDGTPEEIPAARLAIGDRVLVRPGARMPGDGVIEDGRSELDRSLLTGETLPVAVGPDAVVSAGEVNLTGPLTVRLTAVGRDSSLARMAELVAVAESGRDNYTPLADRAAKLYAPGVHILSALSFLGWLVWSGDVRISLNIAAAVLIITCPCALGLAVPAVTTAASGRLFRRGLLIKNGTALERLADVETVVFDKTGTLTAGEPVATNLDAFAKEDLAVLRGLAEGSAHPLAQAAVRGVADLGVAAAVIAAREERPGDGIHGTWNGRAVRLGRSDADAGATATWFSIGDGPARPILFSDRLRPGAERAVRELAAMGLSVRLLSGDAEGPVERLAADLGIDQWTARCRPEEKARIVQNLAQNGHRVLMVGDGLNDTAALAAAHVSVSPASALDAARVASDIVLLGTDLGPLPDAVRVARKATTRIAENFRIATLYNIIAVPLAVAGMATPLIAALAMSISSITVSLNALRLGRRT